MSQNIKKKTMKKLTDNFHLYFEYNEFDSPDVKGSYEHMNVEFLNKIAYARKVAGCGFKITSGYRTPSHNEKVGGVPSSSHIAGRACDIYAPTSRQKFLILSALLEAGFNRIGIAKNFIHVDDDPSKAEDVIWTY